LRLVPEREVRAGQERPTRDAELVHALRAGDPDAPAALWARYSPSVGRVLAKALGPTLEIEDLTPRSRSKEAKPFGHAGTLVRSWMPRWAAKCALR